MTALEKLETRIAAVTAAIEAVQNAMSIDQKITHETFANRKFTAALDELNSVKSGLTALKLRIMTVWR